MLLFDSILSSWMSHHGDRSRLSTKLHTLPKLVFPGHRAFEWQRLGLLASFCITRLLHAGHTEGFWWLVVFLHKKHSFMRSLPVTIGIAEATSKPFKIFACLKSQRYQVLRRLRVMATLEWTPSAACKQFTWPWTVQETPTVSTSNLFELSVDYSISVYFL